MTATWKDLCLDALDPQLMGGFWAAVTGLELETSGEDVSLVGPTPAHRIWVNRVDRAPTVKNRLHLDLDTGSIRDLVDLGATVLLPGEESGFGWTQMADPEGNEFCGFLRDPAELPAYPLHGVVIDSLDPFAAGAWWGGVLGATPITYAEHGYASLERVAVDNRMTLDFVPVPEPRVGPNRVHWDLYGDVEELVGAGARVLCEQPRWVTMADPEGNEFCVFPVLPDSDA